MYPEFVPAGSTHNFVSPERSTSVQPNYGCPVKATTKVLTGKWKVAIVWHLSFGSKRFAEIRNLLPGVSEKVLTAQLRQLEDDGVLRRWVTPSLPPRVDYELTAAGKELIPIMQAMCDWGSKYLGIVPALPRAVPLSA
jgi:DNA-binding HxlR family transcriptional regulator